MTYKQAWLDLQYLELHLPKKMEKMHIEGNPFFSLISLLVSHILVPIKLSGRCFGLNTPGSNFIEKSTQIMVNYQFFLPKETIKSKWQLRKPHEAQTKALSLWVEGVLCHSCQAAVGSTVLSLFDFTCTSVPLISRKKKRKELIELSGEHCA